MPNQPKTPRHSFRIPDELYAAAQDKAIEGGETVSDVVRRCLELYIKDGHGVKDADFTPQAEDG